MTSFVEDIQTLRDICKQHKIDDKLKKSIEELEEGLKQLEAKDKKKKAKKTPDALIKEFEGKVKAVYKTEMKILQKNEEYNGVIKKIASTQTPGLQSENSTSTPNSRGSPSVSNRESQDSQKNARKEALKKTNESQVTEVESQGSQKNARKEALKKTNESQMTEVESKGTPKHTSLIHVTKDSSKKTNEAQETKMQMDAMEEELQQLRKESQELTEVKKYLEQQKEQLPSGFSLLDVLKNLTTELNGLKNERNGLQEDIFKRETELQAIKKAVTGEEKCQPEKSTLNTVIDMKKEYQEIKDKVQSLMQNVVSAAETKPRTIDDQLQVLHQQSKELWNIKKTFVELCLSEEKKTEYEITADNIVEWMTRKRKDEKQPLKETKPKTPVGKKEQKSPQNQQHTPQFPQSQELLIIKNACVGLVKENRQTKSDITADDIASWITRLRNERDKEANFLWAIKQELGLKKMPEQSYGTEQMHEGQEETLQKVIHRIREMADATHEIMLIHGQILKIPKHVSQANNSPKQQCEEIKLKLQEYQSRVKEQEGQITKLTVERESALNRLSEVAGAKLTDGNPNITDLSDPNRPIKIGEQYNELYDNLWTDAYDELIKSKGKEKEAIELLLDILEGSYEYCRETASRQQIQIVKDLTLVSLSGVESNPVRRQNSDDRHLGTFLTDEDVSKLLMITEHPNNDANREIIKKMYRKLGLTDVDVKQLKNMIRQSAECSSPMVQQGFTRSLSKELKKHKVDILETYAHKCAQVCWLMLAQDPPVCLRPWKRDMNGKFDKDVYREYTCSGTLLDFVVWPALYLHESGPLLRKGVAQPIPGASLSKSKKK